jgi:hypothetical protein
MRPLVGIAMVGLCMSAACSSSSVPEIEACTGPQNSARCKGAVLQFCSSGMCAFGACVGPAWVTADTCIAPKVCKTSTIPEIPYYLQNGCYDANSSCAEEGLATCDMSSLALPGDLWTCSRSSANNSLQWTLTACDQQSPPAICLPDSSWMFSSPPTACYEVAGTCPPSARSSTRCEGNVVSFCSGPTIVNGKAVLNWMPNDDCTLTGGVCRNGACVAP